MTDTRTSDPVDFLHAEQAAVFLADESRHPYDVDAVLGDPSVYDQCYRLAKRLTPARLANTLEDAKRTLDAWHGMFSDCQ